MFMHQSLERRRKVFHLKILEVARQFVGFRRIHGRIFLVFQPLFRIAFYGVGFGQLCLGLLVETVEAFSGDCIDDFHCFD